MEWSRPTQQGEIPTPRAGHAGVTVGENWFIVGGGDNKNGMLPSFFLFHSFHNHPCLFLLDNLLALTNLEATVAKMKKVNLLNGNTFSPLDVQLTRLTTPQNGMR